jgi:hypothetical protein
VWYDADGDGIQDANELGLAGVEVTLTSGSGLQVTTTTDADGRYLFPNLLLDDTYTVVLTVPAGYVPTTNTVQDTDLTVAEPIDKTLDFGLDSPIKAIKIRPHGDVCATWSFWYYIYITNTSEVVLENLTVTDVLPPQISPWSVLVSEPGEYDGDRTVTWDLPPLGPGFHTHVWIHARTHSSAARTWMTNRAWIESDALGVPLPLQDEALVSVCEQEPPGTPVPTPTRTATPTATPTPTMTPTPTPTPTGTLIPTPTEPQPIIEERYIYLPLLRRHSP